MALEAYVRLPDIRATNRDFFPDLDFVTFWQNRTSEVLSDACPEVPGGPNKRYQESSNPWKSYVPCYTLPGVSLHFLSFEAILVRGPRNPQKSSRSPATLDFLDLNYEFRGNIPPALVYLVQTAQVLPKVTMLASESGDPLRGSRYKLVI